MKLLLPLLLAASLYADSLTDLIDSTLGNELRCLALNIYHESRGSSYADQAAVADVTMNRVESSRYPNTVCGVVKQAKLWKGNPIRNKCQFSWYCDGKSDRMVDTDAKHRAQLLAVQVLVHNAYRGLTSGSLMYHASYINPYWSSSYQFVSTIGAHKYYRVKN